MSNFNMSLGCFFSSVEEPCQNSLWQGIRNCAIDNGISLSCIIGVAQRNSIVIDVYYNIMSSYIDTVANDGYIYLGGQIRAIVGDTYAGSIINHFNRDKLVTVFEKSDTVPYVVSDNYNGMYQIVTHLIEQHGIKKPIYIGGPKGNWEYDERERAVVDVAKKYGIDFDTFSVCHSDITAAVSKSCFEELHLTRRIDFDSVICGDDDIALAILDHIGETVPITGFDNIKIESKYEITTAAQPFFEMGRGALNTLLQVVNNNDKKQLEHSFECPLVIRNSCGCTMSINDSKTEGDRVTPFSISFKESLHKIENCHTKESLKEILRIELSKIGVDRLFVATHNEPKFYNKFGWTEPQTITPSFLIENGKINQLNKSEKIPLNRLISYEKSIGDDKFRITYILPITFENIQYGVLFIDDFGIEDYSAYETIKLSVSKAYKNIMSHQPLDR